MTKDKPMTDEEVEPPTNESTVKVPESFQKEAMALIQSCTSMAQVDFLTSELNEKRQELNKEKTDEFSSDAMPPMNG